MPVLFELLINFKLRSLAAGSLLQTSYRSNISTSPGEWKQNLNG
jgi:hypothetical protein